MFVKISVAEAEKHIGEYAHIKTVEGEHKFKGKLVKHPDYGIAIQVGNGDPDGRATETEPSFVELHPLILGEQEILLWAAPGEPDFTLLEESKSDGQSANENLETEASPTSAATTTPDSGRQTDGEDNSVPEGNVGADAGAGESKQPATESEDEGYF